jgi:hypothetical protein
MKKGFSLFTPLVGTAIVIMTILIASSMVQNDVRISRSITASYITSSQGVAAKLIKASAELHVLDQMKKGAKEFLSDGYTAVCDTSDQCVEAAVEYYEKADILDLKLTTGAYGIFEGMTGSVSLIARYIPTKMSSCFEDHDCINRVTSSDQRQCCMSAAVREIQFMHGSIAKENFENTDCPYGRYYVNIDSSTMQGYEAFNVEFQSQTDPGNKLTVSVIPSALSYRTDRPIGDYICELGKAFETAAKGVYGDVTLPKDANEAYMCVYGDEGDFLIHAKWGIFNLGFKTLDYVKGGQYYAVGTSGSAAGAPPNPLQNPCGLVITPPNGGGITPNGGIQPV